MSEGQEAEEPGDPGTGGPAAARARAAVFLDRDGTLNEDAGYVGFRRDFAWLPGAVAAVRRLNEAGLVVVVVTNQAGVARGYYTEADVARLHDAVQADLVTAGARIDAFYYAPHHPDGVVEGYVGPHPDRKPGTGMFERAAREHGLDYSRSFAVGDKESDVTPGRALGMTTVLVRTGYGRAQEAAGTAADHVVDDLPAAAALILRLHAQRPA